MTWREEKSLVKYIVRNLNGNYIDHDKCKGCSSVIFYFIFLFFYHVLTPLKYRKSTIWCVAHLFVLFFITFFSSSSSSSAFLPCDEDLCVYLVIHTDSYSFSDRVLLNRAWECSHFLLYFSKAVAFIEKEICENVLFSIMIIALSNDFEFNFFLNHFSCIFLYVWIISSKICYFLLN